MKYKKLLLFVGCLVVVAVLWKSCGNEGAGSRSAMENTVSQRRIGHEGPTSRLDEIRKYVQLGNVPIRFCGRVIDENGVGLEGVSVGYRVRRGEYFFGAVKVHADRGTVLSGSDGVFEISRQKGSSLEVGPFVKDGYRDAQSNVRSFGYMGSPEPHEPDAGKPELFVMVRDGAPRAKDIGHKTLAFAWNQGKVRIPLGKKLGNFVLVPTRAMKKGELRDFDWSVKVSMERAELVSLGGYYAALAPSDGYQSGFEYAARRGDPNWRGGLQATYAFKTADGLYGLVRLDVYPEREDFVVNGSLSVLLNESGSRNLDR